MLFSLVGGNGLQIWDKFVDAKAGNPAVTAYIVEGGLMTFDRRGGVTFVHEGSFNGFSQFGPESRSGSYSVQPNCIGSFTMNYASSPPSLTCCTNHYDFVIVAKGRQLTIFQRDPGTVSAGTAIKQEVIDNAELRAQPTLGGGRFGRLTRLSGAVERSGLDLEPRLFMPRIQFRAGQIGRPFADRVVSRRTRTGPSDR